MLSLQEALTLASVVLIMCGSTARSQLEIQAFQPAVVPIRAITTLTLKTNVKLNVTSHTTLQCRFKDISVPAKIKDGFIFCDTPPIKNTDRVPLHLDIDGKLFKTKKPLYFHEPFKVSNVTPSVVSPAQNVLLTVSGISCKEWIQYFVKFQTANGTKKTQQGICKDSVVSCYVPEFPPNTRLRVGVTLSNRLVEWADTKIIIQYPIDAIRSTVKDINTDITRKGAFTFFVVLKDRFKNPIKIINKKHARISVQYSSQDKPQSLRFLQCTTTLRNSREGDEYLLNCAGAEKENIFFYPSINNVPLGEQDRYEAKTTLCPGKNSCKAEPKSFLLVIVLSSVGIALLLLLVAVLIFVRYQAAKKTRVAPERTSELEMEIHRPKNEDRMVVYQVENSALETSDEEEKAPSPARDNVVDDTGLVGDSLLGVSGAHQESERGHQTGVLEEVENLEQQTSGNEGEGDEQSAKGIIMKDHQIDTELSAAKDCKESAPSSPSSQTDLTDAFLGVESLAATAGSSDVEDVERTAFTNDAARASSCGGQFIDRVQFIDSDSLLGVSGAHQESERDRQTEVLEEVENLEQQTSGNEGEGDEQSAKGIVMKDHQIDTELSAAKDSKESAPSSPSSQTDLTDAFLGVESLAATAGSSDVEDMEPTAFTNDAACASSCGGQFIDRARKQSAKGRKSRLDSNRVRPAQCESTTPCQIKYTERFKKADEYRQAWINNILGGDEPPENKSDT